MKRLVRSRSGRQIYGRKWQNTDGSFNEIESDAGRHSASVESAEIAQVSDTESGNTSPTPASGVAAAPLITGQDHENHQTSTGNGKRSSSFHQSMYRAALEGDWLAAEMLLGQVPTLASDEITARSDRALHVAAAMKHKEFVQKLAERMSPSDLEILLDGHGYTACCYAAISGTVEIAELMMKKNPNLGTARDKYGMTPLQKAAESGTAKMVSYFLKSAEVEDLSEKEWFDLLLVTIRREMYDVALNIVGKNGCISTMTNEEGTALHLLARQEVLVVDTRRVRTYNGVMQPNLRLLTKKLWAEINLRLEEASAIELMKNPPILHDAAKAGNVELITMLTQAYPDFIWHTDSNGYTIFHIAVIYRQENIFSLIHQMGAAKHFIAITRDENGNNILHLAGKLAPPDRRDILPLIALQMQREVVWFKEVERFVPPSCPEMRNKDGQTPREIFSEEHESLLKQSETWMKNTADSCMLIATIMLTVVFAAAFTVPGGYNQDTGIPILKSKTFWFNCFVISEALALFYSIKSILHFLSVMTSSFKEGQFLLTLPASLSLGLGCLLWSLVYAISALMSAYFLVFVRAGKAAALIICAIVLVYVKLLHSIFLRYKHLWLVVRLPEKLRKRMSRRGRHTLFKKQGTTRKNKYISCIY